MKDEDLPVAAVCGSEVRLYGARDDVTKVRPLLRVRQMAHYGAAVQYAHEYDEMQKPRKADRPVR
jgi:hypothetical protein